MGGPGSGARPKQYDAALVERVRRLYLEEGMSQVEVAAECGVGLKVIYNLMIRHEIPRRPQVKRDQRGAKNASWKGDDAKYEALHIRVDVARGKPSLCEWCGATTGRFEWANLTGDYTNVNDYARLCVSCHRKFDAERRTQSGTRTSPKRGR